MSEAKKNKILIIEDEALVARELSIRLTNMGCEVVGIAYGSEGIELARQTQPDLLLTDIHLKDGEDGIEMAQIIRAERDVPVVFLTAFSDEDTVSRAKAVTPYGYIIKPVENRELQIAIDMALYKFSIEKELRGTQQLLQNALTCIGSALIFIDKRGCISQLNADAQALLQISASHVIGQPWQANFAKAGSSISHKITAALESDGVVKLAPFIYHQSTQNALLLDGLVGPMEEGGVLILRSLSEISDPIEMMSKPGELMNQVSNDRLSPTESLMCQLLIALKRPATTVLLEEVVELLNQTLRSTDLVSIYSGSQLSVSMPYTSLPDGESIADQLLSTLSSHFVASKLEFSIGLSYSAPGDQQPFELFRRASWALKLAQDSGGGRVIVWDEKSEQSLKSPSSEAEKQREYHNLVLLWNVLNVVAKADDLLEVSEKLCSHLVQSFALRRATVLVNRNDAVVSLASVEARVGGVCASTDLSFSRGVFLKVQEVLSSEQTYAALTDAYIFRLSSEKVLYLQARIELVPNDIEFIKTLVAYFATGLHRFELSSESPSDVVEEGTLIYSSASMMSIMESIKLVAPTDATVLVTGESGTGKEMIAKAIHDQSERRDKPFIIVDCGAVVGSLIESELFGHVKGAFTGADKNFSGRLKEARGGTVLLDEIGELPLDVQVKLLRYVQDREVAAVGGSKYETVDTRVIAATNRNLKSQVDEGLFRQDLYYRLNVFTVDTPPLRERVDDILLLAKHYMNVYADRYGKSIEDMTQDAKQALLQYRWPGNIRELINIINRGVILCRDSQLSTIHLGLFPTNEVAPSTTGHLGPMGSLTLWIKQTLDTQLSNSFTAHQRAATRPRFEPLGQWLEEDIIFECLAFNSEILNRAALSLGIPESTLRRKVGRLREVYGDNRPVRDSDWDQFHEQLPVLLDYARKLGESVFELVSQALLRDLEQRHLNKKDAAVLMGVSLPTYRRLVALSANIS